MIYENDDYRALIAMECARLHDDDGDVICADCRDGLVCPVCGAVVPRFFYLNDEEECVGCDRCVTKSEMPY